MDAEGRFLSHAVSAVRMAGGQSRRRRRREVGEGNDEWEGPRGVEEDQEPVARQESLYYNVTVFGREFHLRLHHNARLVAPGAKIEWRDDSDSTRHSEPLHDECLYVGDITDTPGATVAISNCDGLVSAQPSFAEHASLGVEGNPAFEIDIEIPPKVKVRYFYPMTLSVQSASLSC